MLELNRLYNMDCLEGMAQFPDKYFELAIVDPPYGIGVFTNNKHTDVNGKRIKNKKTFSDNYSWNDNIPVRSYFKKLIRVSKNRIIWGANYYNCFENNNGALIWDKGDQTKTVSQCEIASLSFQTKVSYVKINWQSGFFRKKKEGGVIHPCQKPIALYKWLLKNYAKPGDKILDTHAGSCSSVIACIDGGFDWIAFELDKDYYKAALKRINNHTKQTDLFNEKKSDYSQKVLF